MRGRWLLGVVAVCLITGANACGSSGYQYVENEDHGVFARLPEEWSIYDEGEVFAVRSVLGGGGVELDRERARTWLRAFDGSPESEVVNTFVYSAGEPRGVVRIQVLTEAQRESVNLTTLRGFETRNLLDPPVDPVVAQREDGSGPTELILDEPVEFDGGFHGQHTVYLVTEAEQRMAVVDQTILLSADNGVLYQFAVWCSPRCYQETYKDEIANVVDSWTIQETD